MKKPHECPNDHVIEWCSEHIAYCQECCDENRMALHIAPSDTPVNQEIESMLREGLSYRQIERKLGVSHSTIAQIRRVLRSSVLKGPIFNDELEDDL